MSDASNSQRSFWRFSLRELMLVMLTTAAVLGWGRAVYQKYGRFSPTPFSDYFFRRLRDDIGAVSVDLGGKPPIVVSGLFGQKNADERIGIHREIWIDVPLASPQEDSFLDELLDRIPKRIHWSGCNVASCGVSGNMNGPDLYFHYRRGLTIGVLQVQVQRKDEQSVHVLAILDELKP
jgi:hypothetical protein